MRKTLSLLRRCVEDYDMIQPGERVAVGVSGGKDSLLLLAGLAQLSRFYPAPFTVEDFTLEKFQAAFQDALERREELRESTARRLDSLIAKLDRNEELIRAIMERKK